MLCLQRSLVLKKAIAPRTFHVNLFTKQNQYRSFSGENKPTDSQSKEDSSAQYFKQVTQTVGATATPKNKNVELDPEQYILNKISNIKLRRSWFYTPGTERKKIEKALSIAPDVVCFDIEDGVAFSAKEQARENIAETLSVLQSQFASKKIETYVRINGIDSGMDLEDLHTVLSKARPDGIVLPKVESAEHVQRIVKILAEYESRHYVEASVKAEVQLNQARKEMKGKDMPPMDASLANIKYTFFKLFLGIESAKGLLNLKEILTADPRIEGVYLGAEDYISEVGGKRSISRKEVSWARGHLLAHTTAYGLTAIDMVSPDLKGGEELFKECLDGACFGFVGKQAIHPNQLEAIHRAFSPSYDDIMEASEIVSGFLEAAKSGVGVYSRKGKMIELPIAVAHAKTLQLAKLIHEKESM